MTDIPMEERIEPQPLDRLLSERYLAYALSTIMHRALPDVRDGLKPVHRRLLYAMRLLRLDPASGHKKCARIVGDVIGKYHPHGDQAVYDALVRLAQDFAVRYPLIDGQGNFGNVDGDNAAAMRYTEARLSAVAEALLDGLDEDTVAFQPNYDGTEEEPVVLPAAFPNLLANGASGIAVGMATNIPPHNVAEICDALLHLIAKPDAALDDLVALMPGPDLPTGGVLVEPEAAIRAAYASGRGGFRLRARWQREEVGRGGWCIVVTEIPYQVQKAKLVERIAELIQSRRLPLLEDLRDESTEEVRLVLVPRGRGGTPETLMEQLFRLTDLEVRLGLNMTVLDATRTPRQMSLPEVLRAFLDHRREVLLRRSRFRLGRIAHRLEVLEGHLVAFLNLDEVIRIIREEDEPKAELMRAFALSAVQAEAILDMRLRHLRRLEEMELRREHAALSAEGKRLETLLKSEKRQWNALAAEIRDLRARFGPETALGRRRTTIAPAAETEAVPALSVAREPLTVVLSEKGWLRALKGHVAAEELRYKEGDRGRFVLHAMSDDRLLLFASDGRFYTLACAKLPGGRGQSEPLRLHIDLGESEDIVALKTYVPEGRLLVASSDGRGFLLREEEALAATRAGKQVLVCGADAVARLCRAAAGDMVAVLGDNRRLLVFAREELPEMARGRGVMLQKYYGGTLADAVVFDSAQGLSWTDPAGRRHGLSDLAEWRGARGQAGRPVPRGFPRANRFGV